MSKNDTQKDEQVSSGLLNSRENDVRTAIALGVEANKFLTSKLAEYINNTAEMKVLSAQEQLSTVDPTDTTEIIRLQTVIAQFKHYESCLREVVAVGDSAYQMYQAEFHSDQ